MEIKKWVKGQKQYWNFIPAPFSFGSRTAKGKSFTECWFQYSLDKPCLAFQNWQRNWTKTWNDSVWCLRRAFSETDWRKDGIWIIRSMFRMFLQTNAVTPCPDHIKIPRGQQCLWLHSLDSERGPTMILRRPRRRRRTIVVLLAVSGAGLLLLLWTGGEEEERQEKEIPCLDGGQVGH